MIQKVFFLSLILFIAFNPETSLGQGQKTVKFNVDDPEMISTEGLELFLNQSDEVKIVIRNSEFEYDAHLYDLNYIYNIIEKEFLKTGFSVKDRALYEEVVNRSEDALDYPSIKEKTDTDLILEIVRLETDLDYITDSYFNNKGVKTVLYKEGKVHVKGARVEFKLILVERNEIVGNYVFNYVPCSKGCPIRLRDYEVIFEDDFGEKLPKNVYQTFTQDQLEIFMKEASHTLIKHLDSLVIKSQD